ncbi:lactonase family protein [Arthrobacter sp. TMN-49]
MPSTPAIFVSGYTEEGYGAGPGLSRFEMFADGTVGPQLGKSAAVLNPSFLSAGGGLLLAVEERTQGHVVAVDPLTLELLGRAPTLGADPCHVALAEGNVWVANYSSGTASVLSRDGLLGGATTAPHVLAHPGSGPVVERQGESHAHQVTPTPWGSVLVADLGADRVDEYAAVGEDHTLLRSAQLPPGTGPRHVAIKGDFLLVAGELDGCVHVLQRTPRRTSSATAEADYFWHWLFKTALAPAADESEAAPEFYPSHIQLSSDGRKLYAAVRGPDTLVTLDVTGLDVQAGSTAAPAAPRFLGEVWCGGKWPRHFAVGHHKIYVANQLSNTVAVLELGADGLPGADVVQWLDYGSPTCVLLA